MAAKKSTSMPNKKQRAEQDASIFERPSPSWLRAIIDIIAESDEPLTIDQISDAVGERVPTQTQAPIDKSLDILLTEHLVEEAPRPHHFKLTSSGADLRLGFVRERTS